MQIKKSHNANKKSQRKLKEVTTRIKSQHKSEGRNTNEKPRWK